MLEVFEAVSENRLKEITLHLTIKKVITTVMASEGYPKSYKKGFEITGLEKVDQDVTVFHAGTKTENGKVLLQTAEGCLVCLPHKIVLSRHIKSI